MDLGATARSMLRLTRATGSSRSSVSRKSDSEQAMSALDISERAEADRRRVERSRFADDVEYFEFLVERAVGEARA